MLAYNFSWYSLLILCVSVVIFPFSFLILFVCAGSLFFLISLTRGLSILYIFSKNQLLLSSILCIVPFSSVLFISGPIFIVFLHLLTMGPICSSFSCCDSFQFRLFIWDCSSLLRETCIAIYFPLSTALSVSHQFCVVQFLLLSFVSIYCLISVFIRSLIRWLFRSMLLICHAVVGFFILFA